MHRNLLERSDLGEEQRLSAMVELGQDYLKAGLLDRAEEVFGKLKASAHRAQALKFLLEIYQHEKDWTKAIEIARELERDSGQSAQKEIANYYCELAVSEATHSRPEAARRHVEAALSAHRKCVRANLILGDLFRRRGRPCERHRGVEKDRTADPGVSDPGSRSACLESHRALGRTEEGLTLLRGYLAGFPSLDLLDVAFQSHAGHGGAGGGVQAGARRVAAQPDAAGAGQAARGGGPRGFPRAARRLELVRNLVHGHTRRIARYRCDNCGFKARQFYWHCPACGGWETYPPRRSEEFDLTP